MHKIVTSAIVTLAFTISANPASGEERTIRVDYSDLDFSSDSAAAELKGRILAAVRRVCGDPEHRNMRVAQSREECRESALQSAYGQLSGMLDNDQRMALALPLSRDGRP